MTNSFSRRAAFMLGAGAATAATVAMAGPAAAAPAADTSERNLPPQERIRRVYQRQKTRARGTWHAHIALVDEAGVPQPVVQDDADHVTKGYSVQKLAVATAVMDKIDRGELQLGQKLDLPGDIILKGSGIYFLHTVWGDQITIANFLTAMLLVSDNTAVRMCGRVVPALEINEILAAKGFVHTRVEPVSRPDRFYLGDTTPREMHDLLWRLATKTLLTPASCDFLLGILRWINGYHDGIRRNMSSTERARVATKYGADSNSLGASRHEAGIMFGADGAPALVYSLFAEALGDIENYGATHAAVEAHAVLGRTMYDVVERVTHPTITAKQNLVPFVAVDGG
jgi:beta-lactamase class A